MGREKMGNSGKVMSLTTIHYLKTHERDYNTHDLSGAVSVENTDKTVTPCRPSWKKRRKIRHGVIIELIVDWVMAQNGFYEF